MHFKPNNGHFLSKNWKFGDKNNIFYKIIYKNVILSVYNNNFLFNAKKYT